VAPWDDIDDIPTPGPDESQDSFRIRVLEHRQKAVIHELREIMRLRRDIAIATLVILMSIAIASPQVWAIVLATAGAVWKELHSSVVR